MITPTLRVLLVVCSGFAITHAHTTHPLFALVALLPWFAAITLPTPPPLRTTLLLSAFPYAIAGAHMWGVTSISIPLYLGAIVYLSLSGVLFALLASRALHAPSASLQSLGVASAWTLSEALRSLPPTGLFPAILGSTLVDLPPLNQCAALAGPWGLSALLALTSAACLTPFQEAHNTTPTRYRLPLGVGALVFFACVGGAIRLSTAPTSLHTPQTHSAPLDPSAWLTVSVVQPSTPDWLHRRAWMLQRLQHASDTNTTSLLREAAQPTSWGSPPDWIVVPESAFGRIFPPDPLGTQAILSQAPPNWSEHTDILTTFSLQKRTSAGLGIENRTALLRRPSKDARGQVIASAWKASFVPLIEGAYHTDADAPQRKTLPTRTLSAGVLTCYESLFSTLGLDRLREGAEVLVVSTNNAGQRMSDASRWHGRMTRMRALETGLGLVYASQAGPSFVIDAYGRRVDGPDLFERGVLTVAMAKKKTWTLYGVTGHGWLVLFVLGLVSASRRPTAKDEADGGHGEKREEGGERG